MSSLIGAHDDGLLWAAIIGIAAFGVWAERSALGRRISGAVIVLMVGFGLGNLNLLPVKAPVYTAVFSNFIPLGIGLLLLQLDLKALKSEAGPILTIFMIGALGTTLGAFIGFHLFLLPTDGNAVAGMLAATYIGGSVNLVAVADAFRVTEGDIMVPVIASDTIATIVYLLILGLIPALKPLRHVFERRQRTAVPVADQAAAGSHWSAARFDIGSVLLALLLVMLFAAAGDAIQARFDMPGAKILTVTVLALAAATLFSAQMQRLKGTFQLGMGFLFVFFAALGANGDLRALIETGPVVLFFAFTVILVHFLVVFPAGYLLKLPLSAVTTASNACVCGSATAGPMAADAGWTHLVGPGIVIGMLGTAIASFIGIALAGWLG